MFKLKWIDFHVCNLVLAANDKRFLSIKMFKIKNFANFSNSVLEEVFYDPEQAIYNFSSHT